MVIIEMKRLNLSTIYMFYLLAQGSLAERNDIPPSAGIIQHTLEDNWSKKKYKQVKEYIDDLNATYCGYVPAQITQIIESNKFGGQVELAIEQIDALRLSLQKHMRYVSPVFVDSLESRRARYSSLAKYYEQNNITKKSRAKNENPLLKSSFQHSKRWGDELLYFNTPEIFVTITGVIAVDSKDDYKLDEKYLNHSEHEILHQISSRECDILTKKYLVKEVVKRRAKSNDTSEVLKGLTEGAIGYTYGETVKTMAKDGDKYIPSILAMLDVSSRSANETKLWIWALVCMNKTDETVLNAINKIANNTRDQQSVRDYAKRALVFLRGQEDTDKDTFH